MFRFCQLVCCVTLLITGWLAVSGLASAEEDPVAMQLRRQALVHRAIRKTLEETTVLNFIETPLEDFVGYLEDLHNLHIELDIRGLDAVGIDSDMPITKEIKGISLRAALNIVLRDLELAFIIRDEVLMITTSGQMENTSFTKVYDVKDLAEDEQSLAKLVNAVNLARHEEKKGSGVAGFRGTLIVLASQAQHDRTERLLAMLRQSLGLDRPTDRHPLQGWRPGKSVNLAYIPITAEDIAYLKEHKHIESLNLSGTSIRDEALVSLQGLENLKHLDLSETRVTGFALSHLKSLPSLERLNLADVSISDKDISSLGMFSNLKQLTIGNWRTRECKLTQEGAKELTKAMAGCEVRVLRLASQRKVDPFGGGGQKDPFGGGDKNDPFGARGAKKDPFGGGEKNDPFGAGGGKKDPFGGGGQKDPFGSKAKDLSDDDPFKE